MNRQILVLAIVLLVAALSVTGCGPTMGGSAPTPTIVLLAAVASTVDEGNSTDVAPTPILLEEPATTPPQTQDTATPSPLAAPVLEVEGKVTTYGLNVRTGPGTAYSIIGGLSLGDAVKVVGKNATDDWLQIVYNEQKGWIAAAYVDLTGSLAAVPEVSAPPPPTPDELPTLRPSSGQARPTETPELTGKLVFQTSNGGDIYVINADGSGLRRLTDGMDPVWSPDGTKVAFARWRDPRGIYVIDEDGRNETLLFGWSQAKAPAWSSDGRYIAFTRRYGGREVDKEYSFPGFHWVSPANPWWKLGLVRVEDRYFTDLPCYDHSFSPTWSPDGKVIAYQSDFGIHLTSPDGSFGDQTYGRHINALSTDIRDTAPAWSPDGSKVAFMFNQHDHWEIYVMNADGANRLRLTHEEPFAGPPPHNVSPAWSPDSRHIAFFTNRNGKWELYVMDADGSNQRPLFETALNDLPIEYGFVAERMVSWTK